MDPPQWRLPNVQSAAPPYALPTPGVRPCHWTDIAVGGMCALPRSRRLKARYDLRRGPGSAQARDAAFDRARARTYQSFHTTS
jgi:hypothetical protein